MNRDSEGNSSCTLAAAWTDAGGVRNGVMDPDLMGVDLTGAMDPDLAVLAVMDLTGAPALGGPPANIFEGEIAARLG